MKRSQMINAIRQKLVGTAINGPVVNALSPEFPEQILMLIEHLGMSPPLVNPISAGGGDYFCPGNVWEPEDGKWFK